MTIRTLLGGLELRQPNVLRCLFERDRDFHAEFDLFDGAVDHVGDESRTFVEIDPSDNVGDVGLEGFRGGAADDLPNHSERINLALAAHRRPFDPFAATLVARRTRRPHPSATILTALNYEFLLRGGVPERLRFRGDRRQWFSDVDFSHRVYASFPKTATAQQPRFLP